MGDRIIKASGLIIKPNPRENPLIIKWDKEFPFWYFLKNKNPRRIKVVIDTELREVWEYAHVIVLKPKIKLTIIEFLKVILNERLMKKKRKTEKAEKKGP